MEEKEDKQMNSNENMTAGTKATETEANSLIKAAERARSAMEFARCARKELEEIDFGVPDSISWYIEGMISDIEKLEKELRTCGREWTRKALELEAETMKSQETAETA